MQNKREIHVKNEADCKEFSEFLGVKWKEEIMICIKYECSNGTSG